MNTRIAFATLALGIAAAALAADIIMRPGRWEMTVEVAIPGEETSGGDSTTSIDCITEEDVENLESADWLAVGTGCAVSTENASANEIKYSFDCDDDGAQYSLAYELTFHSPDSLSGMAVSQSADPAQSFTMKIEGERTGDACSAEELAADGEE